MEQGERLLCKHRLPRHPEWRIRSRTAAGEKTANPGELRVVADCARRSYHTPNLHCYWGDQNRASRAIAKIAAALGDAAGGVHSNLFCGVEIAPPPLGDLDHQIRH